MEIKDLVSFSINEETQTLNVAFRLIIDNEDEVREDQINLDEIKKFGYDFLDNNSQKFKNLFEDFGDYDDEFDSFGDYDDELLEESIDDQEVISFLNEYYLINPKNIPDPEMF